MQNGSKLTEKNNVWFDIALAVRTGANLSLIHSSPYNVLRDFLSAADAVSSIKIPYSESGVVYPSQFFKVASPSGIGR